MIVQSRLPTPLAHNASYGWRLGRDELFKEFSSKSSFVPGKA